MSAGYNQVSLQQSTLSTLPTAISNLESSIDELRAAQPSPPPASTNPNQNLPLPATLSLISEREAEMAALDRQIQSLQTQLPRKIREADAAERELGILEKKKGEVVAQAVEARRRKENGEADPNGVEDAGRWYRSAERVLGDVVG